MLYIDNEPAKQRLKEVIAFAKQHNIAHQLCGQLDYLGHYGCHKENVQLTRCKLYADFAPHSFVFLMERQGWDGKRHNCIYEPYFNGGLIYQGPSCPADGSFPTLVVSLATGVGWFVHT